MECRHGGGEPEEGRNDAQRGRPPAAADHGAAQGPTAHGNLGFVRGIRKILKLMEMVGRHNVATPVLL